MKHKIKKLILSITLFGTLFLTGCICEHEYNEGIVTKEATCLETGEKIYTCNLCQKEKMESIPLADHKYDNGTITKEATCTEKGIKTLTCTVCNATNEEPIPTIAHEYTEDITKEATFEEEGIKTFTCKNCGDSYTESIPARDDKIVLTVIEKNDIPEDTSAWRFSPFVELMCRVENMTDKDIKGVQGVLTINDLFGVEILSMHWDITGEVIPAHSYIIQENYGLDINEFRNDHMKLYNTNYSDLQFEYKVTQIVYTDGTNEILNPDL